MGSSDEIDELEDPISLVQDNVEVSEVIYERIDDFVDLEDSDSDTGTAEVDREHSSYRNKAFILPISFFDIHSNIRLLNQCRPLSIQIVDCDKYPWYYKKLTSRSSANIDNAIKVCAGTVILSPVVRIEKDEDILDIDSKDNIVSVVDENTKRTESFIDEIQKHTGNDSYIIDHIVSKDIYMSQKSNDQLDVKKEKVSKKNGAQVDFKGDNNLIDLKIKPRKGANRIISDNKKKAYYTISKQRKSNKRFNIEGYIRLLKKALENVGADVTGLNSDIKIDDKKSDNNSIFISNFKYMKESNGENIQSKITTSEKDRHNCRSEKDYSIYSNILRKEIGSTMTNNNCLKTCFSHTVKNQIGYKVTNGNTKDNRELLKKIYRHENLVKRYLSVNSSSSLIPCFIIENETETSKFKTNATMQDLTGSHSVKNLPNKVVAKSHDDLNRIEKVQNDTLSAVKQIQNNYIQSSYPQVSSKIDLNAIFDSKNNFHQNSVATNDQTSTHQVFSHNFNIDNSCNNSQTNSFLTTGNNTQLIYQHDVKHDDGCPIQTFISNRAENLEKETYSVLRTIKYHKQQNFTPQKSPINCNYYTFYPNNLIHPVSYNTYNCMNNSFSISHYGNQNYVWSTLYPENYFYHSLSTLPRPPSSSQPPSVPQPTPPPLPQTASPVQQFGMIKPNIQTLPKQHMRNLMNVEDINDQRNIEVTTVSSRRNNYREGRNNSNESLLYQDRTTLEVIKSNGPNTIQNVLEMSSYGVEQNSQGSTILNRVPEKTNPLTTNKHEILPHFTKNVQNRNKNLINIEKENKGYSPPILPIMPYKKTIEMLDKQYKTQMITSNNNINETSAASKEYNAYGKNNAIKRKCLEVEALDQYKKRNFIMNRFDDLTSSISKIVRRRN